jgi:hypothetical protein
MTSVTACGWEIMITCEPSTSWPRGERRVGEKPQCVEPVVDGDHDSSARRELGAVVVAAAIFGEAAAVNPNEHRSAAFVTAVQRRVYTLRYRQASLKVPGGANGRHPSRPGHQGDPAITQRPGLRRQQQATPPLVQMRQDHLELRCQHPLINLHDHGHTRSMTKQSEHVDVNLRRILSGGLEGDFPWLSGRELCWDTGVLTAAWAGLPVGVAVRIRAVFQ